MYLKANNLHRYILGFVLLFTLIAGILIFFCPPSLFPDPAAGFQVMRCMLMGGGFNLSITPSQSDVTQNTVTFLTWWSPGQYMLPYWFTATFGTNPGQSAALTVLFCDVLGILGFYSFFRKVGFPHIIAASSVLFIACQQYFFIPYIFYNGGETLLFGFLGWFLYGCFSFKKFSWQLFVFVILSGWVGFFCKSAYLWMYASGLLCLWINLSSHQKQISAWIKNGIILAIPTVISFGAIYKFFLSKGINPASASPGFKLSLEAFGFPLASPLLSGFSIDELLHGLIFHQDEALFSPAVALLILVLLALLSVGLFVVILRLVPHRQYKIALSAFYGVAVLFFLSVFLRRLNISYEGRHFRIIGLLFIPGTVYVFTQFKPVLKYVFVVCWLAIAVTSVRFLIKDYSFNVQTSAHGPSGFSQQAIDQQSLNYLHQLDISQPPNALFAFISNDVGLDIMRHRIISMDQFDDADIPGYIENNEYEGRSGPLFILLPAAFEKNGNVDVFKRCFRQYTNFSLQRLSKDYILLSAE